jgi:dihydrofolate reductase
VTTLKAIWAQSRSGVIGADGAIPWHVPEDLTYFKNVTSGSPVIMGRRTWQSLPDQFRPLLGRHNIVISRDTAFRAAGAVVAHSLDAALAAAASLASDAWIIGGGAVYAGAMNVLREVHVTEIDIEVDGDVRAPELGADWNRTQVDPGEHGWHISRTGVRYRFVVYVRRSDSRPIPSRSGGY